MNPRVASSIERESLHRQMKEMRKEMLGRQHAEEALPEAQNKFTRFTRALDLGESVHTVLAAASFQSALFEFVLPVPAND
jgi:hypothetical protein